MKKTLLSQRLESLMQDKGLRAAELARRCGLTQPTVHRIVTGQSAHPHASSLAPLAEFFGVSVDQLRGLEKLPKEKKPLTSQLIPIEWDKIIDHLNKKKTRDKTFSTNMPDESMAPQFPKDSLLIFNSSRGVNDRCFVLVKLNSGPMIFRQLLCNGNSKYLHALNETLPKQTQELSDEDIIAGVLIESRCYY